LNSESFPIIEKNAGNITQIKILKSYILSSSESTKNITIVALASNIKVCIIQIEPKHSVIYVLPKPSFINEIYSPYVAWDEGLFRYNEKKHRDKSIFLLICWEKYIDLLTFKENFDEKEDCFSLKYSVVGSLVLNIPVIYMTFISFNLIVGFSEDSQIFLLYLDDFKESEESVMKKEEFNESFLYEIKGFLQIKKKLLKSENEFICVNSKKEENSLFFIDKEENFEVLEVFSWQKFLNKLNEIDKKMAIYKTFEIYEHGNIDFIALIPKSSKFRKKNMKEFIRTIMKNHLIFCLDNEKEGFNEQKVKEATKIVIDFVLRIEEFDFFFQEIVKIFKDRELLNVLFVCLENYLENEKFRYFCVFLQEGKFDLIQKLILSLDLNKIDNFQIIAICMEFQLFKPLIYICTIYNNDFLTPLVKITSHYFSLKKNISLDDANKNSIGLLFYFLLFLYFLRFLFLNLYLLINCFVFFKDFYGTSNCV